MSRENLGELAAAKRREYKKAWNAKNRDKCREYVRRYWEKKALLEPTEHQQQVSGEHQ